MNKRCRTCKISKNIEDFEKCAAKTDKLHPDCRHCKREYQKQYRIKNHSKVRISELKCKTKRKENGKERAYLKLRYMNNIQYNMAYKLRKRLRSGIRKMFKLNKISMVGNLGCSLEELKKYLESKFTKDMSWKDLLEGKIHIDHIKPLSKFDLTKEEEQRKAIHYSNLQPLWAKDNLSKGNK